ncbi:hypothetical protein AB0I54_22175 [Streptomyces sp. NPDC050625]|uniref:hypothetical protein n=1 Tax=Streptomyces sp. NPDC050625 TaxID=3154629 RepID=UPI00341AEC80
MTDKPEAGEDLPARADVLVSADIADWADGTDYSSYRRRPCRPRADAQEAPKAPEAVPEADADNTAEGEGQDDEEAVTDAPPGT